MPFLHRALALAVALLPSACFLDAAGSAQEQPGGGGSGGAPAGAGGSGGAPDGPGGAGAGGEGGNGGGIPCEPDGVVVAPEQCEDGNTNPGDDCSNCVLMHDCDNTQLEPTEECYGQSAQCEDCVIVGGPCFEAAPLVPGDNLEFPTSDANQPYFELSEVGDCKTAKQTAPSWIFRFDAGPYPRGFVIDVVDAAGGANNVDPLLFMSQGCAIRPLDCVHDTSDATLASPVLSAGTIIHGGIADENGAPDTVIASVRYHRLYEQFTSSPQLWDLTGGFLWDNASNIDLDDPPAPASARSPQAFVGGLSEVVLGARYRLKNDAMCEVRFSVARDDDDFAPVGDPLPKAEMQGRAVTTVELSGATKLRIGIEVSAATPCHLTLDDLAIVEPLAAP